jgi:hypothetical protein
MKSLACVCVLFAGVALAGTIPAQRTIDLPSPDVMQYYVNANCVGPRIAWTAANGFSADGNYVLGISQGYVACGHSGRGSNLRYTYYCMLDKWDLSGNLISVVVQPPYLTCPKKLLGEYWTNAGGYRTYTVTNVYYGYIQSQYAVLETP